MAAIVVNERNIVDTTQLLGLAGAAIGGMSVGAIACHWYLGQVIALLRQRLERAVLLRNSELERADQARAQIAQLNAAINDLRRTHSAALASGSITEQARPATAADEKPTPVLRAFADTQIMT